VAAHHHCLRAGAAAQSGPVVPELPLPVSSPAAGSAAPPGRTCRLAERTRARYPEVHESLARGLSRSAVSRELSLDIQTVPGSRTLRAWRNCSAGRTPSHQARPLRRPGQPALERGRDQRRSHPFRAAHPRVQRRRPDRAPLPKALPAARCQPKPPGPAPPQAGPRRSGRPEATHDQQGAAYPPRPPDRERRTDPEERHRPAAPASNASSSTSGHSPRS
jgi:hypothetical protein